ncbi:hypothetical protein MNBD_ALPHA08-2320 [hydrothermal vent metagenome]|uniref:DUF1330 domain-containing protein n=1 Tax=hydrothermal vent metagenome TaxID=652676 RepID=A0A3B0SLF9_9ZZZZ
MSVIVVGMLKMHDPSWTAEYGPRQAELVEKHHGQYLIAPGKVETLEGSSQAPDLIIVIEFPDRQHAMDWYADPEQASLVELRQAGSDTDLFVINAK